MSRLWITLMVWFAHSYCMGQTFKGGVLDIPSWGGYSSTNIVVSDLPNQLDGVNRGLESVEVYFQKLNPINKIELFLLAPDGTKIILTFNNGSNTNVSGVMKFAMNAPTSIQNWSATAILPSSGFKPNQSLDAFANGNNPNGTWKIYGQHTSSFSLVASSRIDSIKLIFGSTNIRKAEPNDECVNATALKISEPITEINTSNYSSNLNTTTWRTDVLSSQVSGSPSGNDWTENTAWYSFKPLCNDDKIYIKNSAYTGAQIGIFEGCSPKIPITQKSLAAQPGGIDHTFTFSALNPSKTYYVVIDGVNANYVNIKELTWQKGTTGCATIPVNGVTTDLLVSSLCTGSAISVPFTATGTFAPDNTFTAQLSDANGTFASPAVIGVISSSVSGTINANLPTTLPSGANYKIRTVASSPLTIGSESTSIAIGTKPNAPTSISGEANPCAGQVNLLYSSSSVANATTYFWTRSDGGSFVAETGKPDSSSIRLTGSVTNETIIVRARNACGLSDPMQKIITLGTAPVTPVFKTFKEELCEGKANETFAIEPVSGHSYSWKFQASTTITNATVDSSQVIITAGSNSGTVEVLAKNGCGISSPVTKPLSIKKKPLTPNNIVGESVICTNQNQYAFSTSAISGATSFRWTFPLGYAFMGANGVDSLEVFVKPGKTNGTVKLFAVNECGNSLPLEKTLTIDSLPPTPVADKGLFELCEGTPRPAVPAFEIKKAPVNSPTFTWTNPPFTQITSGTSDSANIIVVLQNNISTATFGVRSKNACGLSTNSLPIVVNYIANQPATIAINYADTVACANAPRTFKTIASNVDSNASYKWYIGGQLQAGATQSEFTTTINAANSTIQSRVTSALSCASPADASSQILPIKAIAESAPQISVEAQDTEICAGETTSFLAIIANAGNAGSIKWFLQGNEVANEHNTIFSPGTLPANASVYAALTVTSVCGTPFMINSNTATVTTQLTISPTLSITFAPADTLCVGIEKTLTATAGNAGNNVEYQWIANGATIPNANGATFTHRLEEGLNEVVCILSSNSPCAIPKKVTTTTIIGWASSPPAVPSWITSSEVVCLDSNTHTYSVTENDSVNYKWIIPEILQGNSIKSIINLKAIATGTGLINVSAQNKCGTSPMATLAIEVTSCDSIYVPNVFSGNPSPSWQVEGLEKYPKAVTRVYNRWGSLVHEKKKHDTLWDGTNSHGNPLPIGTYYYVIELNDRQARTITGAITITK